MPTTMAVHDDHFIQNQSNRFKMKKLVKASKTRATEKQRCLLLW
jgi:hypothetical protein